MTTLVDGKNGLNTLRVYFKTNDLLNEEILERLDIIRKMTNE